MLASTAGVVPADPPGGAGRATPVADRAASLADRAALRAGPATVAGRALPLAARAAPRQAAVRWLAGDWIDYAPSGVPDFSQCRAAWSRPGEPGQWTYAAPTALADALWWLDSVAEPAPRPPATPSDGHGLVTFYPVFGPARDDHAAANVAPLVEDLAFRVNTDGRRQGDAVLGTRWEDLVAGARKYVDDRRLGGRYQTQTAWAPDVAWVQARAARNAGIVLLLGVWEDQDGEWRRVGGHYAAVAGVGEGSDWLALADPLADGAALGGPGRAVPPDAGPHGCRTAPLAHDDAGIVAHDAYRLAGEPGLPGGRAVLADYFTAASAGEAAAFRGQNPAAGLAGHAAAWRRGAVVMAMDAALAIVPAAAPEPSASAPPEATATATASATDGTPTAPSTPRPTTTPGATVTITWPTVGPSATFGPTSAVHLPWVAGR